MKLSRAILHGMYSHCGARIDQWCSNAEPSPQERLQGLSVLPVSLALNGNLKSCVVLFLCLETDIYREKEKCYKGVYFLGGGVH